jgi:hypothetical protein
MLCVLQDLGPRRELGLFFLEKWFVLAAVEPLDECSWEKAQPLYLQKLSDPEPQGLLCTCTKTSLFLVVPPDQQEAEIISRVDKMQADFSLILQHLEIATACVPNGVTVLEPGLLPYCGLLCTVFIKMTAEAGHHRITPVILATQEAEIRRTVV